VSNDWVIVNNKLEWLWRETVVALFKVISSRLSGGSEKIYIK
jgi:hypothetical protein